MVGILMMRISTYYDTDVQHILPSTLSHICLSSTTFENYLFDHLTTVFNFDSSLQSDHNYVSHHFHIRINVYDLNRK